MCAETAWPPVIPAMDAKLTMRPDLRAFIYGMTAEMQFAAPTTFTSYTRCQFGSGNLGKGVLSWQIPALLTKTSMRE